MEAGCAESLHPALARNCSLVLILLLLCDILYAHLLPIWSSVPTMRTLSGLIIVENSMHKARAGCELAGVCSAPVGAQVVEEQSRGQHRQGSAKSSVSLCLCCVTNTFSCCVHTSRGCVLQPNCNEVAHLFCALLLFLAGDSSQPVSGPEVSDMAAGSEWWFGVLHYSAVFFLCHCSYASFLSVSPGPSFMPFFALSSLLFSSFYICF